MKISAALPLVAISLGLGAQTIATPQTTPQSAGVLDAENDNISLESGTKFTVNVTPANAGM